MHHGIQHLLVFGILLPYLLKGKRMSLLNCDCHSMNRKKKKKKLVIGCVWFGTEKVDLIHMTLSRAQLWKWFSKQTLTAVPKPSLIGRERRKQRFQVYFGLMQQLQDVHLLLAFRRLNRCKI